MYAALSDKYRLISEKNRFMLISRTNDSRYAISTPMALILSLLSGKETIEDINIKVNEIFKDNISLENYLHKISSNIDDLIIYSKEPIWDVGTIECGSIDLKNNHPLFYDMLKTNRYPVPQKIVYNVINCCQFNCVYCFSKKNLHPLSDNRLIDFDHLESFFAESAKGGCKEVILTGGDPVLHPGIIDIITMIGKLNMKSVMSTKTLIDKEFCIRLKSAGLSELQFSLDSFNEMTNNYLTGVSNDRNEILKTLHSISAAELNHHIKTVLTQKNYNEFAEFLKILFDLGEKRVYINTYIGNDDNLVLNSYMLDEIYKTIKFFNNMGMNVIIEGNRQKHICGSLVHTIYLNENGKLYYCFKDFSLDELCLGSIKEYSLDKLWNSKKALGLLTPEQSKFIGKCQNCIKYQKCIYYGCYYERFINSGNIFGESKTCV